MRRNKRAIAVDRADTVGVAIQGETCIVVALANRLSQRLHMGINRLWIHAAEKRIARPANFVSRDTLAAEQIKQQSAARAVHGIDDESKSRSTKTIPIDKLCERFEVRSAHIQ